MGPDLGADSIKSGITSLMVGFVLVILFSSISFGQNDYRTWIKGKVLYKNVSVVGANVINNTSQSATITNNEGEFEIEFLFEESASELMMSHSSL